MIKIALVIGLAFVIQFVLSSFQMKNFNNEFVRLRRKGKVAIGRKSGGFHAGAIVMFRIDEKGIIQESRKIEGTTFLARVKDFPGFEGATPGENGCTCTWTSSSFRGVLRGADSRMLQGWSFASVALTVQI